MHDSIKELKKLKKETYNEEPVCYCKKCLSLNIVVLDGDIDCCNNCGSTDTNYTLIEDWENLYSKRYGRLYINK